MAFDEKLASRVRRELAGLRGVTERKMFGGICFMLNGNMCCGVLGTDLIVKIGKAAHDAEAQRSYARVFDFSGRPMKGMLYVGPKGVATAAALRSRLKPAIAYISSLPAK